MKKNTIYTLLCTTILIPGIALGMQDDKQPDQTPKKVPQTPVSKIKAQISAIPKTPSQDDREKAHLVDHSPFTSKYLAKKDILEMKAEHATIRMKLMTQLQEEEFNKQLRAAEEAEKKRFESLSEKKEAEDLAEAKRNEEIESMRLRDESIQKELDQKKSEITRMEKELEEAKEAAKAQRAQKIDIMDQASETESSLLKMLQETEEKYNLLTSEHFQVKIKLSKLTLEKQTDHKLKGIPIPESTPKKQPNSSAQKPSDVVSNTTTVPVPVQQQGGIINQPLGDGANTVKQKRTAKKETDTTFTESKI